MQTECPEKGMELGKGQEHESHKEQPRKMGEPSLEKKGGLERVF